MEPAPALMRRQSLTNSPYDNTKQSIELSLEAAEASVGTNLGQATPVCVRPCSDTLMPLLASNVAGRCAALHALRKY